MTSSWHGAPAALIVAAWLIALQLVSAQSGLKILVVEGEDAVNIIQQKTAIAPIVEVRDRNDQPVAGAVVRFAIGRGRATFSGARTLTVTTNAAGRAAATGLTPTGAGAVQISASATFQGQTAVATIAQTNVMTAAQAANVSTAAGAGGGGSGGGIGTGTMVAIGGGAAGGVVGYQQYRKYIEGNPPEFSTFGLQPTNALQNGTLVQAVAIVFGDIAESKFNPDQNLLTIDYGDGTVETKPYWISENGACCAGNRFNHRFTTLGTFTVRATYTDQFERSTSSETTTTVFSLTGRWTSSASTGSYTLAQNGSSISGSFTAASGTGSGAVSGSVAEAAGCIPYCDFGQITMTLPTQVGSTIVNATFTAQPHVASSSGVGFLLDPNRIRGSLVGPGINNPDVFLTRQ